MNFTPDIPTVTASGLTAGGVAVAAVRWALRSNEARIKAVESNNALLQKQNESCEARYNQVRTTLDNLWMQVMTMLQTQGRV